MLTYVDDIINFWCNTYPLKSSSRSRGFGMIECCAMLFGSKKVAIKSCYIKHHYQYLEANKLYIDLNRLMFSFSSLFVEHRWCFRSRKATQQILWPYCQLSIVWYWSLHSVICSFTVALNVLPMKVNKREP